MIKIKRRFFPGAIQLADPKNWVLSFIPATIGMVLAVVTGGVKLALPDIGWIFLAFCGLALIETGKNAINEYVDFITGVDPAVDAAHATHFSGGKKTITGGLLELKQVLFITITSFLSAGAIGLVIILFKSQHVLEIGLAGILLSLLYSMPPFKFCYRGLGEFAIALAFGPLTVCGAYVLLAGDLKLLPVLVSVPIGLMIADLLIIREIPDYEADLGGNKRNLVVRLGKERAMILFGCIAILTYLIYIGISIYTGAYVWILPILSSPLAWIAYSNGMAYLENIPQFTQSYTKMMQIYVLNGGLVLISILLLFIF